MSTEYDGANRTLYNTQCVVCGKDMWVPKHRLTKKSCSVECNVIYSKRNQVTLSCDLCGKEFKLAKNKAKLGKTGLKFCSRECKDKAQRVEIGMIKPAHYKTGINSYRDQAFRLYGKVCNKCGYNKDERMLDVHHIDGDRENNDKDNLIVYCVWCHALYTRGIIPVQFKGRTYGC